MNIAEKYIQGLKEAYSARQGEALWRDFEKTARGASRRDIQALRRLYPEIPDSLVELLEIFDGTYWREYPGGKVHFLFLGSDIEEFPYYLLSARQMIEKDGYFASWGDYIITREYDDVPVDRGVCDDLENMRWLHFADCMNNGGTSQLFIDFTPSAKGKKGQIVRYLHDPDEAKIIADSFDDYLQMLIDRDFDFINPEVIEEW